MARAAGRIELARSILANPRLMRAGPSLNWFLLRYLLKFTVTETGGRLIIHSHFPPLNSKAYSRFIDEHVLSRSAGPSHAQIGITNACPQKCGYCYNRGREGIVMDTGTILSVIRDLKSMGVFWIGLTGGEPLLNRDIVKIVEAIGDDCSAKLFTTGCGLTRELASDLKRAGLYYVTVSLDHWDEKTHDRIRGYPGAYRAALRAIETFRSLGDMHVSVSTVLSGSMIGAGEVQGLLAFLRSLGIDEAWLSEAKPSFGPECEPADVITESERLDLIRLQDSCNRRGGMTVNYLGHFEDGKHFGCTAGYKMVYVDPFGDVNPCVFVPMSFGNVRERPLRALYGEMRARCRPEDRCFVNANHGSIRNHAHGKLPLSVEDSRAVLDEVMFGPLPRFFRIQNI